MKKYKVKIMSEDILKSIDQKLSVMIKLLAINSVKEKNEKDQMVFLKQIGLNSTEIGAILGKSPSNVRVQLSAKKRKVKK